MSDIQKASRYVVATFEKSSQGRLPSALVAMTVAIGAALGGMVFGAGVLFNVLPATWENVAVTAGIGMVLTYMFAQLAGGKSHRKFNRMMTQKINESILELTGDKSQYLRIDHVRMILAEKQSEPLLINGVSGIEISVETLKSTYADDGKAVVFKVAEQDDGGASFSLLVANAARDNPDIEAVFSLYEDQDVLEES